jgi:hypothetical protein
VDGPGRPIRCWTHRAMPVAYRSMPKTSRHSKWVRWPSQRTRLPPTSTLVAPPSRAHPYTAVTKGGGKGGRRAALHSHSLTHPTRAHILSASHRETYLASVQQVTAAQLKGRRASFDALVRAFVPLPLPLCAGIDRCPSIRHAVACPCSVPNHARVQPHAYTYNTYTQTRPHTRTRARPHSLMSMCGG